MTRDQQLIVMSKENDRLTDANRDAALRVYLLEHVLTRILTDLPISRDWLDPQVERAARELIRPPTNHPGRG